MITIAVVFWWIYGRFAGKLYFVLDDTIETYAALSRTLGQAIADSFTGRLNWSGYRPVSYATRALLSHLFTLDTVIGYYLVSLGLHLANTFLFFALARLLLGNLAWGFVAAIFFLLLPAHNEAVLYMSANANLIALFFSLVSLLTALAPRRPARGWWSALSAIAYLLAVLAYEVVLPLPLFVFLADWRRGERPRQRALLYAGYGAAVMIALGLRVWAGDGRLTPARSDYAISLAPLHLLQGYAILLGQMILLHTSAWIGLPLFSNVREWMSPLNPRALISITLVVVGSIVSLYFALRAQPAPSSAAAAPAERRTYLFWIGWGLLWLATMSILFAALAGRYPENRYTYIPSLGLSMAVAALIGWVYVALAGRSLLRGAWLGLVVVVLAGYAYVSTSDVSAWERASLHTRSFMQGAVERLPALPNGAVIAQVGVPGVVGNAYTFNTEESFHAAMQLLYGPAVGRTMGSDLALAAALEKDAVLGEHGALLAYDRASHTVHPAERALFCDADAECRSYRFQTSAGAAPPWVYVQFYQEEIPQAGGLAMLFDQVDSGPPNQRSCWAFYDLERVEIAPTEFDNTELAARCQQIGAEIVAAGVLTQAEAP